MTIIEGILGTVGGLAAVTVVSFPFVVGKQRPDRFDALSSRLQASVPKLWGWGTACVAGYIVGHSLRDEAWAAWLPLAALGALTLYAAYVVAVVIWGDYMLSGREGEPKNLNRKGDRQAPSQRDPDA